MYVVDASVWVSSLLSADVHHEPSSQWLQDLVDIGRPIVAPTVVLAEVAGAVARQTGLPRLGVRSASLLQGVPSARFVPVDAELGQLAAQTAAELRLRGVDAIYVALAKRLGIPLVTWDQEQRERGRAVVAVLTPEEALTS